MSVELDPDSAEPVANWFRADGKGLDRLQMAGVVGTGLATDRTNRKAKRSKSPI